MEIISETSYFTDGKHEIMFGSKPHQDKDGEVYDINTVQSFNGGDVNFMTVDLDYQIHWKEYAKVVDYVSFTMPRDEDKLGDVFCTTPYGLIKKNRTGIGATTLELESKRNSIIVVPTRTLANDKAKGTMIGGTGKYGVLYVGSPISGYNYPNIDEYLEDKDIPVKKFMVVVDSLPKLLTHIGKEKWSDYFLMIDEIDSYQYDSSYRSAMETALDYYWLFPRKNRCLVSATITSFSDKRIEQEPIIEVYFNTPQNRNIELTHTNNVEITCQKLIERLVKEHPNEKILVAYNAVIHGILPIIKLLPEKLQEQCSILCSLKSKHLVEDYYTEIRDGLLSTQITFMTCTYFVGIDIQERFHLISIANTDITHTLLSPEKLQQIVGRCRNKLGVYSETIVYKTKEWKGDKDFETSDSLLHEAHKLSKFYQTLLAFSKTYPKVIQYYNGYGIDEFVKNAKRKYMGLTSEYAIIRNSFNSLKPAYFVIDSILIQQSLTTDLYTSSEKLELALQSNNLAISSESAFIPEKLKQIKKDIDKAVDLSRKEEIDKLIQLLKDESKVDRAEKANLLKADCTRFGSVFLDYFIEFQPYVPFDTLTEKLREIKTKAQYKFFKNATIFFALEDQHPIKKTITDEFVIGEKVFYTGIEVVTKANIVWSAILGNSPMTTPKDAFDKMKYFFAKKEERKRNVNGNPKPQRVYKILSYDVIGFNCTPLKRISKKENVRDLLDF